jgi:hypothetical protein
VSLAGKVSGETYEETRGSPESTREQGINCPNFRRQKKKKKERKKTGKKF